MLPITSSFTTRTNQIARDVIVQVRVERVCALTAGISRMQLMRLDLLFGGHSEVDVHIEMPVPHRPPACTCYLPAVFVDLRWDVAVVGKDLDLVFVVLGRRSNGDLYLRLRVLL